MMSAVQAIARRGSAGEALPVVYQVLADREAFIYKGQLTLVVGPPSAGKSTLTANLLMAMQEPALAFLLDIDQTSAVARLAAIASGDRFLDVKASIDNYADMLFDKAGHIQMVFRAVDMDDIKLQLEAYSQRYGEPPAVLLVDNAGNLTSGLDQEWAALKALTLELDEIARDEQVAVILCHHVTDLDSAEPAQRTKILGKISQYPRLILSVGFNPASQAFKIAVVKNSSGPSDINAQNPIVMHSEPSRMLLSEHAPPPPHPQVVQARQERPNYIEQFNDPDLTGSVKKGYSGWRG
jgi:hypothetical protein